MKKLILLVSEQTIPNYLIYKEFEKDIDFVYFVSTPEMEKKDKSAVIIEHLSKEINYKIIQVNGFEIDSIRAKFKETFSDKEQYLVNITGGTKIMSLEAYLYFSSINAEFVYLNLGRGTYTKIQGNSNQNNKLLLSRVRVYDYLKLYGIEIDVKREKLEKNPDIYPEATQYLFNNWMKYKEVVSKFRKIVNGLFKEEYSQKKPLVSLRVFDRIREEMNDIPSMNFINEDNCTFKQGKFLLGDWFEKYIYFVFKDGLALNDASISQGFQIKTGELKVKNELDVVFCYLDSIYIMECKTTVKTTEGSKLDEFIYKSTAISKHFGIQVKPYLVTMDERVDLSSKDIERAKVYGVTIITKTELDSAEEMLRIFNQIKGSN